MPPKQNAANNTAQVRNPAKSSSLVQKAIKEKDGPKRIRHKLVNAVQTCVGLRYKSLDTGPECCTYGRGKNQKTGHRQPQGVFGRALKDDSLEALRLLRGGLLTAQRAIHFGQAFCNGGRPWLTKARWIGPCGSGHVVPARICFYSAIARIVHVCSVTFAS